ncbi:MAG: hypothetical protein EHM21_08205 [Chloroflexi bacterium]|nr:MAG: hypothetical protein EHM21_08205 [Chloroflexota bacterium]
MVRSYALAPETVRRILRRTFWRFQLIAALSFIGFGLYLGFLARPVNWDLAAPMITLITIAYFAIIFYQFRRQLRLLYNERYELDDSSITYRQGKQRPLHIPRSDITGVLERGDGLTIQTARSRKALFIPNGLAREGDTDFRATLGTWVTIQPAPHPPRWYQNKL